MQESNGDTGIENRLEEIVRKERVGQMERRRYTLPYDPIIPLLTMYPKETIIEKDSCTPLFITTLFTIAKTWKQLDVH